MQTFSLLDVAAGGKLHRRFRPRWAGDTDEVLAALQATVWGDTEEEDEELGADEEKPDHQEAEEDVAAICEVCTHPPKHGSLEQCQGETCNLLVCAECKTEQGCDTCDAVADLLDSMDEDLW